MSLGRVSLAKFTCATCAIHQTKVNFILKRIVSCDPMLFDEQLASYLKINLFWRPSWNSVCRVNGPLCVICQIMQLFIWSEKFLWTDTIGAAILGLLWKSCICHPSWKMADSRTLPCLTNSHHTHFYFMNLYASKKRWHTSSSLELPRDSLCSWTKPRTRMLTAIFSTILYWLTSFHHTNGNEVSNEMIFYALRKCSSIIIRKIAI